MALTITPPDGIARFEGKVAAEGREIPADLAGAAILDAPGRDLAELRRLVEGGFASGDAGQSTVEDVERGASRLPAERR